ncbi:MAG: PIN domain-containing protein, partial [Deltaproteobacteria bacterium]|nr:PIN domain-containing protein [Deltaproteobacteria bacterium]
VADPPRCGMHPKASKALLENCYQSGSLIICDIVYSEMSCFFEVQAELDRALETVNIQLVPMDRKASFQGGQLFKKYRTKGGTKNRIMADFLVAAHAVHAADALATRDRGFYRSYFPQLKIIEP